MGAAMTDALQFYGIRFTGVAVDAASAYEDNATQWPSGSSPSWPSLRSGLPSDSEAVVLNFGYNLT